MECNRDNRAATVLALFKDAVEKQGLPSRVRGDQLSGPILDYNL